MRVTPSTFLPATPVAVLLRSPSAAGMLTYTQVLFLFVVPPALVLAHLARPFLGKSDCVRVLFLALLAFVYSTPWCSQECHFISLHLYFSFWIIFLLSRGTKCH